MLRYISIIDIPIVAYLGYAWIFPLKVLSRKDRKGEKMSGEKIALWLPRVRPIILGLLIFLIVGRAAMYHFYPQMADMNARTWGITP